jgi:hypothetical protein
MSVDQSEIPPMFFVGRIDVPHDSGLQRVFGVFDDEAAAAQFRDQVAAHMQGSFMVFEGVARPDASAAAGQEQQ